MCVQGSETLALHVLAFVLQGPCKAACVQAGCYCFKFEGPRAKQALSVVWHMFCWKQDFEQPCPAYWTEVSAGLHVSEGCRRKRSDS